MKTLFYCCLAVFLISCSKSAQTDLTGYEVDTIAGSEALLASRHDPSGKILEKGVLRNGMKDGIWMTFHDNGRVKTLSSYISGKLNGTHFEFNNRGQIEYEAEYLDEEFNGRVAKYNFGRLEELMTYSNGVLEGPFEIYSNRGKLQRKGSFINGKQHGILQYFDENENVIMEYQYDNGEKLSGGIIEIEADSTQNPS